MYKGVVKQLLFQIDPETVHDIAILLGKLMGTNPITRSLTKALFGYSNKKLEQEVCGITFKNPIGLAAGFDKNADLTQIIPYVGFGHSEVGSITGEPCEGNPKPRLWRLKKSKALIVHYGLKNDGAVKLAKKLRSQKQLIPAGISIAKTNCKSTVDTEAGIKDYLKAFKELKDLGSYITINISCPNVFGGEPFTSPEKLEKLLSEIDKIDCSKPIFLKLKPDLEPNQIDQIIKICEQHKITGFVCSNLTKKNKIKENKENHPGGISGLPAQKLSTDQIKYIYQQTKGKYTIIGCGGIFTAEDAYEKIKAGATLLQLITGMIYEGPQVISELNQGLVKLLEKDGYSNISEAIGQN